MSVGARMQTTLEQASRVQPPHRFDVGQGTKFDASPKLSPAGQFYLDCQKCGRTIFEDGSGSAGQNVGCG